MRLVQACLWRGADLPAYSADAYDARYVELLARGVERHVPGGRLQVLADAHYLPKIQDIPGVEAVPFYGQGVGGWSNVLEAFRPSLAPTDGERHLLVGLDTVFTGDCSWLYEWDESPVGLPLDPYRAPTPCDAVVTYSREGAAIVWDEFMRTRGDGMRQHLYAGKPSEMALLRHLYKLHHWNPLEDPPRRLLSYKAQFRPPLHEDTSIVYFHGRPKPADLPEGDPVRKVWT